MQSLSYEWITTNPARSAEKHGTHGGDKAGVPTGATLSREGTEEESSGGCC